METVIFVNLSELNIPKNNLDIPTGRERREVNGDEEEEENENKKRKKQTNKQTKDSNNNCVLHNNYYHSFNDYYLIIMIIIIIIIDMMPAFLHPHYNYFFLSFHISLFSPNQKRRQSGSHV